MRDNTTDLSEVVKGLGLKEKHHAERVVQRPVKASPSKKTGREPVRKKPENMKIIPIGGLDEIGKNMTVLEYQNQMLIVDCGMTFLKTTCSVWTW